MGLSNGTSFAVSHFLFVFLYSQTIIDLIDSLTYLLVLLNEFVVTQNIPNNWS